MRSAIETAEAVGRCVLWVDEIEKAFAGLGSSGSTDSGVSSRVFGNFITWMQEKTAPVFIIATCNRIQSLPPELTRKGRFDTIFFVDTPEIEEREEIFKIHIAKRGRKPEDFDIKALAKAAEGHSGAEIEEAVITALYTAFYREDELKNDYLMSAVLNTTPLSKSQREALMEMRDWADKYAENASKEKVLVTTKKGRTLSLDAEE
jgi:SpoVK/Ycf46/Vps4 family AAA+-type ATPase